MRDEGSVAVLDGPATEGEDFVTLQVQDVTGMCSAEVDIPAAMPAGEAATMVAHELQLTGDVGWGLRNDLNSVYLDDVAPIGRQVGGGAEAKPVTLLPKAHLGGPA